MKSNSKIILSLSIIGLMAFSVLSNNISKKDGKNA